MVISLFNNLWLWFSFCKSLVEASWWERLTGGGIWVLLWWAGPCSVNLEFNFLLMGGAVFPPCCSPWVQTMVEVVAVTVTSFKRTYARTIAFSAPDPAAGHCWPPPPLGTLRRYLNPDILECEVKSALGKIPRNKASGGDGIPAELFQILKDDVVKMLHSVCQEIWT